MKNNDIEQKAREIVKEMDQSGDDHAQKAAEMLRKEFASTTMTADEKRQLIVAIRNGETKGEGADLQVASASTAAIRENPKLANQFYVQLTTKDRPLGDSVWHAAPLYVAQTEPGMKKIEAVSEMKNQAIHIARRMDNGDTHAAAEELRQAGKSMKPEDFQALLKEVSKEEARNVGGDLVKTKPYIEPIKPTDSFVIRDQKAAELAKPTEWSYQMMRTEALTAKEKAAYGGATKNPAFEVIAKQTDNLPSFTIVEGDPRLKY